MSKSNGKQSKIEKLQSYVKSLEEAEQVAKAPGGDLNVISETPTGINNELPEILGEVMQEASDFS